MLILKVMYTILKGIYIKWYVHTGTWYWYLKGACICWYFNVRGTCIHWLHKEQ